jgi:ATP-dependent Lon protease
MLRDLAPRDSAWFRPTLIVGKPGSGKSSFLRAIADQIGLPVELNSLAGSTDSSAMGTSAQWSTVRESVPLQLIKRSKKASVALIWDEVDKASSSRNNGSVIDALLPMLEPDQAGRYFDLALEVEVDLSAVTHFATANDLDSVPQPLRDRFRILTMPEPTWRHLGTLTRQIVDRTAKERGIDPRFFGGLAEDEMDLVRLAWPGGSVRQLTRIVTTIIDGRDQIMGRC